ncbi:MAG: hypothetical protein INR73_11600 [Williamsia sp.]|nr:hypothetical protein [Williamsia sp.]
MNNKPTATSQDLQDSPHDQERMKQEEATLDLPDVRDIPGQEHIKVPVINELADTTASSDDEEGDDVLGNETDEDIEGENPSDISPLERSLLDDADADVPSDDNDRLKRTALDDTDDDGEPLNEASMGTDVNGKDIDVPGQDDDDPMEEIGEEDEENNEYSLGGDSKDTAEDGTV